MHCRDGALAIFLNKDQNPKKRAAHLRYILEHKYPNIHVAWL